MPDGSLCLKSSLSKNENEPFIEKLCKSFSITHKRDKSIAFYVVDLSRLRL